MNKKILFSLIMATYGRDKEVEQFIESLLVQTIDISEIELIIVDQNDIINLDYIIEKYKNIVNIVHIKSSTKGLSYNRNLGLNITRGSYIAFPDDDCTYYPDTLMIVYKTFMENSNTDILLGKIYDRANCKNVIRNWKKKAYKINYFNFYTSYSSITIFTKKNSIYFDENLGVGQYFGSYEDADYILQSLNNQLSLKYIPKIEVLHPELSSDVMSLEKVYSYGLGFGAFCRKHHSFPVYFLMFQVFAFHLFKLSIGVLTFDINEIKKRYIANKSRIVGYLEYMENKT